MSKPAKGFLSNDETFFLTKAEADRHDAEMEIRVFCLSSNIDPERFLSAVRQMPLALLGYINADKECKERECAWSAPEAHQANQPE